jgi:hypothetical protein
MLLILGDDHREHLTFLNTLSLDVVREFCRISVEFLKKGVTAKVYQTAAQKLGVETVVVQKAVEGLMYVLLESSKRLLNEIDFQDSLKTIGLSDELQHELLQQYVENRYGIRNIQKEMSMDLPHYTNLEWRLDVQVASRSLRHQLEPTVTLKLHTADGAQNKVTVLEADPVNLIHLARTLEEALQELNTPHCRRIMRNL